jgi:hypothetical protein
MQRSNTQAPMQGMDPIGDRNRLEIIRFTTADAQRQAIGALLNYGMLNWPTKKTNGSCALLSPASYANSMYLSSG